jgi:hypothetical protein
MPLLVLALVLVILTSSEDLRKSVGYRLADSGMQSDYIIMIQSMDFPCEGLEQTAAIFSYVIMETATKQFMTSSMGLVGAARAEETARDLIATLDRYVSNRRRGLRE